VAHWRKKDDGILLRLEETKGEKGEGRLKTVLPVKEVFLADILGHPQQKIKLRGKEWIFPFQSREIVTLWLKLEEK